MPRISLRHVLLALAILCSGLASSLLQARQYPPLKEVGTGTNSYQFVLKDPVTGTPLAHTHYRLFAYDVTIKDVPLYPGANVSVLFGETDAAGRTALVKLPQAVPEQDWVLTRVVGDGDNGNSFHLIDVFGRVSPGADYVIDIEHGLLYCGRSDEYGNTAFVATRDDRNQDLFLPDALTEADFSWCTENVDIMNRMPTDMTPASRFAVFENRYVTFKDGLSDSLKLIAARKLTDMAIETKDALSVTEAVDLRLKLGQSTDILNNVGYDLINANVLVDRGLDLINRSLQNEPDNFYALDSKGWALFRLARFDEALEWLNKSLSVYLQQQAEDNTALAENYAHRAETLYHLGRTDEARKVLNDGYTIDPESSQILETAQRIGMPLKKGSGSQASAPAII